MGAWQCASRVEMRLDLGIDVVGFLGFLGSGRGAA